MVRGGLRHEIHRDLLLTVALGGLSSVDVREFCRSGRLGCSPWLLAQIAKDGYAGNYTHASKRYGMGVPALKEELLRLELTGMLSREVNDHGLIGVTEKGRAMLDICAYLHAYLSGSASGVMSYSMFAAFSASIFRRSLRVDRRLILISIELISVISILWLWRETPRSS